MLLSPVTPKVKLIKQNGQWIMDHLGKKKGPGHYEPIPVPYDQTGDFTFKITGATATFRNDANQGPITIQKGNAKPTGGVDSQITDINVTDGGKVLTFHDTNKTKGDLNYVLHFSDGTTLDPIIQNGGCCMRAPSAIALDTGTFIAYLVVAFVAGILATLGVSRLRRG